MPTLPRLVRSSLLWPLIYGLAAAAAPAPAVKIEIAAQRLDKALNAWAEQTGFSVMIPMDGAASEHMALHIAGTYTPEEALQLLLTATGLRYEFVDERTVAIRLARKANESQSGAADRSSASPELEEVLVFGTLDNTLSVGSKSGLSLRETPKSITLVTRERIEAQNLSSLEEVMRQTTGVTQQSYTPVDPFYYSRGFRVKTVQIDGGAPADSSAFGLFLTPDTATYDHIEMLRGVDGMYSGAGEPGGVINLVRKRAESTPAARLGLSAGSWNRYRGEIDVTGPLTSDGRLRGRFVAAKEDKDYFYERAKSTKTIAYGTAEYDLTPSTLVIAGASYERRKEDGFATWGFPRFSDGRSLDLPRSDALNVDWAHWYITTKEVFTRAEQKYGATGVIKLNLTHIAQSSENRQFISYGGVDPITRVGNVSYGFGNDYDATQSLYDLSANGTVELFGLEHRYTVGTDYSKIDGGGAKGYRLVGYDYPGPAIDVFNFDPALYPEPVAQQNAYYPENGQTQQGFYATVGLQLLEPLRLTLGGRYGKFRYLQVSQTVNPDGSRLAPRTTRYEDNKFIPSAALTYNFADEWSAYVSYAETFKVQANLLQAPLPGTPLDPITGDGYEMCVKGELFGGLNASAAVYRIERNGQGVRNNAYPNTPTTGGANCCYMQQVNITSEGFDAELSGTVLPGWQLFAGYTHNSNKAEGVDSSTLYSSGARTLTRTPKHMLKMWTTWRLPGRATRWTLNAGVLAMTEGYVMDTAIAAPGSTQRIAYRFSQSGYSVWNSAVQYEVNDTWTVGLYGDNLFDKKYYSVYSNTLYENIYGTPRNFMLTVRGHW